MSRQYPPRRKQPKLMQSKQNRWRGLNTLVSNTQIRPEELSQAVDVMLIEDGKLQCPRDGQAYYGGEVGSRVTGLYPYYKSDGTQEILRTSGTKLQRYGSNTWTDVSGYTYEDDKITNGVMAYDRLYLVNGEDPLTYYDGSSITSFTEISAPGAPTATRTGTSGTFTFSYKITAVTATGETTPSAAGSTTLNQSELNETSYMTVTWSAVTNAIGYNIYGRKDGQWYFIAYNEGNGSTTYVDQGKVTPNEVFIPPEGNSTGGPVGKYIAVYRDSLFILGDPSNPSRLYYSAGGDLINNFSISVGGGFLDVSKNDGQMGTGMIVFKDSLIVFKRNSIFKFNFTSSGLPQFELINPAIGAAAPRSIVAIENDIGFCSDRGFFFLGNQEGFAFDVLRTREVSAKVRSIYQSIASQYVSNISAIYATKNNVNVVILSYTPGGSTTNSRALVFDIERGGWYEWTNIKANCWTQYRESDGTQRVLYGDDSSGYVKEILTGSDDFGSSIRGRFRLNLPIGEENQYIRLKDVDMVLRKPTGSISVSILQDGVQSVFTESITTISPSINWGHYVFSEFLLGESYGEGSVTEADANLLKTLKNLNLQGRNFIMEFDNNSVANFVLLFVGANARPRSLRYRRAQDLIGG
jgi:hypothetical protein